MNGPGSLESLCRRALDDLAQVRSSFSYSLQTQEVGRIISVGTGVALVSGLPGVGYDELIQFPGDVSGIAFNIDRTEVGVVLLGDYWKLEAGDEVYRTGRVMDVVVGDQLLGRVLNPLGHPLDELGPIRGRQRLPLERPAAAIIDRSPVTVPIQTGLKVVDALIPIGRGQRELILGDRQTGKTAIALNTILNQKNRDVICIYCAIGQRASSVARSVATLQENGALEYTVIVVTEGNDPPGLSYIAPYAATSIAEHYMEEGRDVLIVYDDLTHHARAYRELSLLLRRPPGREAFPGDIFYIHSRLLERATHLSAERGGGSLTALPIVETEGQDISSYIPTNLISITDGQIYLSPTLFELGVLPAVDVGKSVSRVGGKAQAHAFRRIAGDLKLSYAQFEELESFSRFGGHMDDRTKKVIEHGRRIRECLKQAEFDPQTVLEQLIVLLALGAGLLDGIDLEKVADAELALRKIAHSISPDIVSALNDLGTLPEKSQEQILDLSRNALMPFLGQSEEQSGHAEAVALHVASGAAQESNSTQNEGKDRS